MVGRPSWALGGPSEAIWSARRPVWGGLEVVLGARTSGLGRQEARRRLSGRRPKRLVLLTARAKTSVLPTARAKTSVLRRRQGGQAAGRPGGREARRQGGQAVWSPARKVPNPRSRRQAELDNFCIDNILDARWGAHLARRPVAPRSVTPACRRSEVPSF